MKRLDELLTQAVTDGVFPQASYAVGNTEVMSLGGEVDTPFDLASLTKVIATTPCVLRLVAEGIWSLDSPWRELVPEVPMEFESVCLRDVLCHRAGYLPHRRLDLEHATPADAWAALVREKPASPPNSEVQYSCLGFLLLGLAVERAVERPFSDFALEVLSPLLFCYSTCKGAAPTEGLEGIVHDENARFLRPNTGNAGLFGNAANVGLFAQSVLRSLVRGESAFGVPPNLWRIATTRKAGSRALGWDTKSEGSSAGSDFGDHSFGHTGFTGTSIWIDPDAAVFSVLLTNRVHPTRNNEAIKEVRPLFKSPAHRQVGLM
ncbi:MAG TPA: serine hydrolase domain-containing protein [Fimbriimonadaceae bacterium]|nr:serine hydrolase domain-containing protein [Fimbriimonadaceae bacterium]